MKSVATKMASEKTLADMLDNTPSEFSPVFLHSPQWVLERESLSLWKSETDKEDNTKKLLLKELDHSSTPTLKSFQSKFSRVLKKSNAPKAQTKPSVVHSASSSLSPQFQHALVERVLAEDRYWPKEAVAELLKLQAVPYSHLTQLCRGCIEHSDKDLLEAILFQCAHLPEAVVVMLLQFFISCFSDEEGAMENSAAKNALLRLFSFKCNESVLICELGALDLKDVLKAVRFLYLLLQEYHFTSKAPTYLQVVDWVGVLVDAHFVSLVMSPEAQKLSVALRTVVCEQGIMLEKMECFDDCLRKIAKGRTQPLDQSPYIIETVNIEFK